MVVCRRERGRRSSATEGLSSNGSGWREAREGREGDSRVA